MMYETVQLSKCKRYIMDDKWYFDNFNQHPYNRNCLVIGYTNNRCIITVLDKNILPFFIILCAGNIKPFKKKITYITTSDGRNTFKDLVQYKCGAVRRDHYTMRNRVDLKPTLVAEFSRLDFSRAWNLWHCDYTLEEYMKKYPNDLRTEHYKDVDLKIVLETDIIDISEDE